MNKRCQIFLLPVSSFYAKRVHVRQEILNSFPQINYRHFSLIGNMYNFEEEKKNTTKSDRIRHFGETVK